MPNIQVLGVGGGRGGGGRGKSLGTRLTAYGAEEKYPDVSRRLPQNRNNTGKLLTVTKTRFVTLDNGDYYHIAHVCTGSIHTKLPQQRGHLL